MKSKILQWSAIALITAIGLLHLLTAQAEYEEAAYMGYLFAANFFGALIAVLGIYHQQVWGWLLGLLISGFDGWLYLEQNAWHARYGSRRMA
jgi:hypothetical protein